MNAALPRFQKSWVQLPLFSVKDFEEKRVPCKVIQWPGGSRRGKTSVVRERQEAEQSAVVPIPSRRLDRLDDLLTPGDPDQAIELVMADAKGRHAPPLVLRVLSMPQIDPREFLKRKTTLPVSEKAAAAATTLDKPSNPTKPRKPKA